MQFRTKKRVSRLRRFAQRYGLEHTELLVKAPVNDILPRLVWHYDEPFGDSSAVPSFAMAQLTRQHVTVVLNGEIQTSMY